VSESQQIFRIIEEFAKVYFSKKFQNADDLFAFAYFILMLQTELHSPAIEKRMTFEDMVLRVAAFNQPLSQDRDYLSTIYYNIKSKPFSKTEKKVRYFDFERVAKLPIQPYSKSLILYHNWTVLYTYLSSEVSFAKK
jgi:Sec7-like guanine-nucleotide exchange factor